jgi:hypothetical protein
MQKKQTQKDPFNNEIGEKNLTFQIKKRPVSPINISGSVNKKNRKHCS